MQDMGHKIFLPVINVQDPNLYQGWIGGFFVLWCGLSADDRRGGYGVFAMGTCFMDDGYVFPIPPHVGKIGSPMVPATFFRAPALTPPPFLQVLAYFQLLGFSHSEL